MSTSGIAETTQHLTFKLDKEVFALDILRVFRVLEYTGVTKVPRTPEFMKGVINFRGGVVPVIDLRLKLGMPEAEKTENTRIIIVEAIVDAVTVVLGLVTDSAQNLLEFISDQIQPAPKIGTTSKTDFIKGIGKHDNQLMIILDIDKVFSKDDLVIM